MNVRFVLQVITVLCIMAGLSVVCVSLFTPNWQYLSTRSLRADRTYGLYEVCIDQSVGSTILENVGHYTWVCTYYDFGYGYYNDYYNYGRGGSLAYENPLNLGGMGGVAGGTGSRYADYGYGNIVNGRVEPWRITVLGLVSSSVLLALFALIFAFAGCAQRFIRCLTMTTAILTVLSAILVISAVAVFARNAYELHNRFFAMPTGSQVQLILGWSFHVGIAGAVCMFVAAVLSVVTSCAAFADDKDYSSGPRGAGNRPTAYFVPNWQQYIPGRGNANVTIAGGGGNNGGPPHSKTTV